MKIVIAPDSFKSSLSSQRCASALAKGILSVAPDCTVVSVPLADGGEGTVDSLVLQGFEAREGLAPDAHGVPRSVRSAWIGTTAVIESSQACVFVPGSSAEDALRASSNGVGVMMSAALDNNASEIMLTVGGTACSDGGKGMLEELGVSFLDVKGKPLAPGGGSLKDLASVELGGLDPRVSRISLRLLSDVVNPLLGPTGAAEVFGPQKGADASAVAELEQGLAKLASLLGSEKASSAGAGAGGGLGYAAMAALGASQESGALTMINLVGLEAHVKSADLVITGEGSFDSQSVNGKLTGQVLALAAGHGVPSIVVCGIESLSENDRGEHLTVDSVVPLSLWEPNRELSITNAETLMEKAGKHVGMLVSESRLSPASKISHDPLP